PFSYANTAGFKVGFVMKTQREIRLAELFIKTVFEQRACASTKLLCWLRDEHDRTVPLTFSLGQNAGHTYECRNVYVMPTGMHYMYVLTFIVFGDDLAGVR